MSERRVRATAADMGVPLDDERRVRLRDLLASAYGVRISDEAIALAALHTFPDRIVPYAQRTLNQSGARLFERIRGESWSWTWSWSASRIRTQFLNELWAELYIRQGGAQ